MANIIVRKTAQNDVDPFASSDNPNARPYDRSADRKFRDNYDGIFRKPVKTRKDDTFSKSPHKGGNANSSL
jgi:hypothetical protein